MDNNLHLSDFEDSRNIEGEQQIHTEMPSVNWTVTQLNSFMFQFFQDIIVDTTNKSATSESTDFVGLVETAKLIIDWGTLAVELPILPLAYALARLIKDDNMASVFVIKLLASDLIQLIVQPAFMLIYTRASSIYLSLSNLFITHNTTSAIETPAFIFYFALSAGNGFTLCIALERYLLVAFPLWYRCKRSFRHSLLVSSPGCSPAYLSCSSPSWLGRSHSSLTTKRVA